MTVSLEAESLAKEALKAADDARKAQQRLQMLKKRYGMMKRGGGANAATRAATPTKRRVEVVSSVPTKTVIAPPSTPPTKTTVEVHKDHHQHQHHEESSTDYTVETRGTGSVVGSVTTTEKRIEEALASLGPPPPPPPPPKVIRAVSPRKEEVVAAAAPAPAAVVETRDEAVSPPPVIRAVSPRNEETATAPAAPAAVVETRDEAVSPPPVIRAVSPRNEETATAPAAPAAVVETRDEAVKTPEAKTEIVADLRMESKDQDEEVVNEKAEEKVVNEEKILAQVKQEINITTSEPAAPPTTEEVAHQESAATANDKVNDIIDSADAAAPEWSEPQKKEETHIVKEEPKEELPQEEPTPVVVEAQKEVEEQVKPVESEPTPQPTPEPTPELSAPVVEEQQQVETATPKEVVQEQKMQEVKREGPKVFSFYEAQAALPVVQEGSEDSGHSREEPVEPVPVMEAKNETQNVVSKMEEPQQGHPLMMKPEPNQQVPEPAHHGREASGTRVETFRLPKPAYMEAEAMMNAMLTDPRPTSPQQRPVMRQQPVGKAMPEMAVSTPPASRYYAASETLQPVDELQQRVAAIPETKDDVPAPHMHEHHEHHEQYGAYPHHPTPYPYQHYADDVSVLTEMVYPKPLSPRHVNREPIAEDPRDPRVYREAEMSRRPINEESSLYGDAPERDARHESRQNYQSQQNYQDHQSQQGNFGHQSHQRNFVQAETPRFRNTGPSTPRGDPVGQLEPDQNDPRQPDVQDPPQINTRQFDHEAGRGMEPSEVRVQPLVSHLRNRAEPEARNQRPSVPRPNRRVQLSVDPYSPRQAEAPEAVSPLSASGQSTARYQQNRAAPLGYNTPYGGYASGNPIVSGMPPMQHRYITTRSGAATVASYHRTQYPGDATVMTHQPMMHHAGSGPMHFSGGGSVASMPYQRTQYYHPAGNGSFHEQHYVSGAASVAPSAGGETIISVRTNARGNKVVKKLVKVEEEDETDPVVAFCDLISIDKVCGIEFDEQYKVVEEELPPEPLTAADVGRNAAMGKKVFNENNYTDPFAGRNNDTSLCGLL